jgi:anti-anti-sigma factor
MMMSTYDDDAIHESSLGIVESDDPDGYVRLALQGELDLATSKTFVARLRQLKREGCNVRLDFSELSFMDSTGLAVLIPALSDASQNGWNLDVDRNLGEQVKMLFDVTGASDLIWPTG